MSMIAIRDAFGDALSALGADNKQVVALEADVGSSTKSAVFGAKFPQRYFNVGISELDMAATAAGMAASGLIPFVNTFAVFLSTRALDAINSMICYDKLNVKLCGAYAGLSDSYDGASHHAISDIAIMRSLPNMTVLSVCDPVETRKAVYAAAAIDGPVYLRLSRAATPTIFDESYDFQVGKGVIVREGRDVSLVATGYMVHKALEAADLLARQGIAARVVNMHTIAPIDRALIDDCARQTRAIVTIEEHSVHGGLGGAVCEAVCAGHPARVERIGLTEPAESGDYEQLLTKFGLDAQAIAARAIAALKE